MRCSPGLWVASKHLRQLLLAVLLLLPFASTPQDYDVLSGGVVRIVSVSAEGKRRTGTGFIVKLESDAAYIVTAHHVVQGDKRPKVFFFVRRDIPVTAEVIQNERTADASLLIVRGRHNLPQGVRVLPLEPERVLKAGDEVATIGFPAGLGDWAVSKCIIGAQRGSRLTLSGTIAEGNSGGPVLRDGKVLAMITSVEGIAALATPALILGYTLQGWGVDWQARTEVAGTAPRDAAKHEAESGQRRKPAPSTPPVATNGHTTMVPEVIAIGKEMLSNLDKTRNTGSGFDYWPNGGIQIAYYHLATFATYGVLGRLSPHPVFVSGPHGASALNLNSRFTFGHYNPKFLVWFHDHLLEILQDRRFVESTTGLFQKFLGETAMTYWATYTVLNEHPRELSALLRDYETRINNRTLPEMYYYNIAWGEAEAHFNSLKTLRASYSTNVVAPAVYFWLRRHIDGTHQQFFSMLDSLLSAYQLVDGQRLYFNPNELPRVQ